MKDQAETNCFHIQFASFVCNSFQIWQTLPQVSGNLCSVQNIRKQFKANTLLQRTDPRHGYGWCCIQHTIRLTDCVHCI